MSLFGLVHLAERLPRRHRLRNRLQPKIQRRREKLADLLRRAVLGPFPPIP